MCIENVISPQFIHAISVQFRELLYEQFVTQPISLYTQIYNLSLGIQNAMKVVYSRDFPSGCWAGRIETIRTLLLTLQQAQDTGLYWSINKIKNLTSWFNVIIQLQLFANELSPEKPEEQEKWMVKQILEYSIQPKNSHLQLSRELVQNIVQTCLRTHENLENEEMQQNCGKEAFIVSKLPILKKRSQKFTNWVQLIQYLSGFVKEELEETKTNEEDTKNLIKKVLHEWLKGSNLPLDKIVDICYKELQIPLMSTKWECPQFPYVEKKFFST